MGENGEGQNEQMGIRLLNENREKITTNNKNNKIKIKKDHGK